MASIEILKQLMAAFNAHDLDRLMVLMTEDCVFFASSGEGPHGETFRGQEDVRAGYARIFDAFPDATWSQDSHFVDGNRGFSEWVFSGTARDGERVVVRGGDAFVFRGEQIQVKDSFRKSIVSKA